MDGAKEPCDFRVIDFGTVHHFTAESEDAQHFLSTTLRFALEDWQILGTNSFAVDHRVAADLSYQLEDEGWHLAA